MESRQMRESFRELMVWLVAWSYSPETRRAHPWWYVRIVGLRINIEVVLRGYPHLRHELYKDRQEAYAHGREVGAEELGVPPESFAETCPWTVLQILTGVLEFDWSPFFEGPY
jgi:hypothetical protein